MPAVLQLYWQPSDDPALTAHASLGRFSHGEVVPLDELRPFQEPDLSSLQAGSACLAKHQDGLWHPAHITGKALPSGPQPGALLPAPSH